MEPAAVPLAVLVDPANTGLGHKQVQRWNLPEGWVISRRPAHAALVSEADFIAAQDTAVRAARRPGGTPVPAGRVIACGQCGRRLESAGPTAGPRTGAVTGTPAPPVPDPARPRNTYVREDQILPHLAALAILLDGRSGELGAGSAVLAQLTGPASAAALIDQLRAEAPS